MENAALENNDSPQLTAARLLVEALERGDEAGADKLVKELAMDRNQVLLREVGKLTRDLHEAVTNIRVDHDIVELAEHDLPDAKERLNYVMAKTEEAAHRTLNAIEASLPLTEVLRERAELVGEEWTRVRRREMDIAEFKTFGDRLADFLHQVCDASSELQEKLSDVLMAQDFQDLTGQVIRRVITLVQDVEHQLIGVIQRTGEMQSATAAEGPQVTGAGRAKSVSSQQEADEILASLGF
jgi:chemotaxis protein CheZ